MSRRPMPSGPALRRRIRWELLPKPGGGTRRLIRLDAIDDLRFTRAVARAGPFVGGALDERSHANRVLGWDPRRGVLLEPWLPARRRWIREVSRLARDARWIAVTDVRACYPSIAADVVAARLGALGVPPATVGEIESWLTTFASEGVEGLPIGPAASAVLADAVLSVGDEAMRRVGRAEHVRWVDDVAIFAPDRRTGLRSLDVLRGSLAAIGLELHDGKTQVFPDPETGAAHLASRRCSPAAVPRCDNRAR